MRLYKLHNIKKYHGGRLALDIPRLILDEGSIYVFYGPNAAGKSTLLNLLAFLSQPSEGDISFCGYGAGRGQRNISRDITLVMQSPYLFKTTVLKNVSYGLRTRSVSKDKIEKIIRPVMEQLGIWAIRERDSHALSEGEKRKTAIARALVLDTKVLLLDEPTAQLDKACADVIENIISNEVSQGRRNVIMTTHDLSRAHRLTNNIIYLYDGKISKAPLWNIFSVGLVESNGVKKAILSHGPEIYTATEKKGNRAIAINPRDIIISQSPVCSSALNSLKGKVINISETEGLINLAVDVGIKLHAFITHKSLRDMRLEMGNEVFATFKASAVEVF